MYTDGHGVTKNYQIAAQLYQKAIQQGDKVAMNNLALMYENGQGVPKDHKKALRLLEDAIAAGNEQAARNYKRIKRIFD